METNLITIEAKTPEEQTALQEYKGLPELENLLALIGKGNQIKVTDNAQVEIISAARETRLELKKTRTAIEAKRKALKENIVLRGKAIDGMANIFKDMIVPVETHLEDQEKFAERAEEKRLSDLAASRESALAPYVTDTSYYNLRSMSEQGFVQLLQSSKIAFEAQRDAERKAEEARKEKEEKDRAEQERIKAENEKLKREQSQRDEEEAKTRKAEQEKLDAERKAREKVEAEAKAIKAEQDRKEREATEKKAADERAAKEAEAKAKRAPDKEKLQKLVLEIVAIKMPDLKSEQAKAVAIEALAGLNNVLVILKIKTAML